MADFEPPPKNFFEPDTTLSVEEPETARGVGSVLVVGMAAFSFSLASKEDSFGIELDLGIEVDAFRLDVTDEDALRLVDVEPDRGRKDATPLRIASTPECRNPNLEVAPLATERQKGRLVS